MAHRISGDFAAEMVGDGKPLVLLGVLKGSFMFLADLARRISIPVEIEFASIGGYGDRPESSVTDSTPPSNIGHSPEFTSWKKPLRPRKTGDEKF